MEKYRMDLPKWFIANESPITQVLFEGEEEDIPDVAIGIIGYRAFYPLANSWGTTPNLEPMNAHVEFIGINQLEEGDWVTTESGCSVSLILKVENLENYIALTRLIIDNPNHSDSLRFEETVTYYNDPSNSKLGKIKLIK